MLEDYIIRKSGTNLPTNIGLYQEVSYVDSYKTFENLKLER